MTSIIIGIALKLGELILDKFIQNNNAKKRVARWLEYIQSRHLQTSAKLSGEYRRLIEKYRNAKGQ